MSSLRRPPNQHNEYFNGSSHHQSNSQTSPPLQQQYESGLEVVPSTSPEWVPTIDAACQYSLEHKIPVYPETSEYFKRHHEAYKGASNGLGSENGVTDANHIASRPWYRKKKIMGALGAVLLLAIGLGAGLGVALSREDNSDDSSKKGDDSGNTSSRDHTGDEPDCDGGFCSGIFSTSLAFGKMYVFGRSADKKTIQFITYDGSDWSKWSDLGGLSGSNYFASPPQLHGWWVNNTYERLDVFAVGSDRRVYNAWTSAEESWPTGWEGIGFNIGSSISTCIGQMSPPRLDLWARESSSGSEDSADTKITHAAWRYHDDDDLSEGAGKGITADFGNYGTSEDWEIQATLSPSKSQPAADGNSAEYSSFSADSDLWSRQQSFEGNWIGEPSLYAIGDDGTDGHFFGLQEDQNLYYLTWSDNGEFESKTPKRLDGGRIYSAPAVNAIEGVIDIVALGENGTLVHQHRDNSDWLEWEELDLQASSAPAMRSADTRLWVFAVNEDGEMMAWWKDHEIERKWKGTLNEVNLRGNLSWEGWEGAS